MIAAPAINLNSPGPVANAFLHDDSFISIGIGPVGSAKTLTALQKGIRNGAMQKGRRDRNGVIWRKSRVGVLRESYPNIDANILPSWHRIVPRASGKFNAKAPYTHHFKKGLRFDLESGKPIDILDITYEFRAIGDSTVQEIMRGWEINMLIVDEGDLQPRDVISYGSGRVGRFSDLDPSSVVNPQIVVVSNMPWTDNWLFEMAFQKSLGDALSDKELAELEAFMPGRKLISSFIQPGGRDPEAENLHNLEPGYYIRQAILNKGDPDYVDRMIDNKPVPRRWGQPVYAGFRHHVHVAKEPLKWDAKRLLIIGLDQGLNAAAVAMQRGQHNEIRSLRETVLFRKDNEKILLKIGPTAFGKAVMKMVNDLAPGIEPSMIRFVADPAAFASRDRADNEHDWVLAVEAQLPKGCRIHRAKSQSPTLRQEAIRTKQDVHGGYLVDASCSTLIAAHLGKYHFVKQEMLNDELRGETLPVLKNIWSNVADAEQYAGLEGEFVVSDITGRGRKRGHTPLRIEHDYDMLEGVG